MQCIDCCCSLPLQVRSLDETLQAVNRQSSCLQSDLEDLEQERDSLKHYVTLLKKQLQNVTDKVGGRVQWLQPWHPPSPKKDTKCNFFLLCLPFPHFLFLPLCFPPSPACCRTMYWREPCTRAASWIKVRSATEMSCPGWWSRTSSCWGRRTSGCRHKCRTSTRTFSSPKKRCKRLGLNSQLLHLHYSFVQNKICEKLPLKGVKYTSRNSC